MNKDEALRLALEALKNNRRTHYYCEDTWYSCPKHEDGCANDSEGDECNCGADKANAGIDQAITAIKAALEAKDEPYAFEASMYPRVKIDPVTGNVSIGTVKKPCGLECDCTDVCEQKTDYKALWQQMCERCDELDKKLAQRTWIGLTNQELADCWDTIPERAMRRVEAKLKEKNT